MKHIIILCLLALLIVGCATQPQVEFKLGEEVLFTESDIIEIKYNQMTRDCFESTELCLFEFNLIPSAYAREVILEAAKEKGIIDQFIINFENKEFHSFQLPSEAQKFEMEVITINGEAAGLGKIQIKKFIAVFEN